MRVVGIRRDRGPVHAAVLSEDGTRVTVLTDLETFWHDAAVRLAGPPTGEVLPITAVEVVPPVLPDAKVFCVGLNYLEHVAEGSFRDEPLPEHPTLFARWPSTLTVNDVPVPVPAGEDGLDWEGEVVAWVGAPLVDSSPQDALAAVVGYSVFNDLTCRRAQRLSSQWILGKNADRSGPVGPLVPAREVGDLRDGLRVLTRVNGQVVQDGRTNEMLYTVGDSLALISTTITLRPGDLLATGTPAGVGYSRTPPWLLQPGDVVEVEVERLGSVRTLIVDNTVRRQRNPAVPSS